MGDPRLFPSIGMSRAHRIPQAGDGAEFGKTGLLGKMKDKQKGLKGKLEQRQATRPGQSHSLNALRRQKEEADGRKEAEGKLLCTMGSTHRAGQ